MQKTCITKKSLARYQSPPLRQIYSANKYLTGIDSIGNNNQRLEKRPNLKIIDTCVCGDHRETSRYALLEFIVSTENLSVCLCLQCNQTKPYTKKCDGRLVNDDEIVK